MSESPQDKPKTANTENQIKNALPKTKANIFGNSFKSRYITPIQISPKFKARGSK